MKKILFILAAFSGFILTAAAQVSVEVALSQDQFLISESLPVAVKITNRSGQPLHLGADPHWLTFNVESVDGFDVVKNADVPVVGEFDLASSQMAIKRVDLEPYFTLNKSGRYRIVATLRIKDWNAEEPSPPKLFDVINGAPIWSQDFGVPVPPEATNRAPMVRKYTLLKANYLLSQLRLYVQVSDPANAQIYKVSAIGPLVSFSQPETQVDQYSKLHILYQSGASVFNYTVVDPTGNVISQDMYDYVNTRPRLAINTQGEVMVAGGVLHIRRSDTPMVKMPDEVLVPAPH